jgi:hypothetical protein
MRTRNENNDLELSHTLIMYRAQYTNIDFALDPKPIGYTAP